jgi:hypothetical protein
MSNFVRAVLLAVPLGFACSPGTPEVRQPTDRTVISEEVATINGNQTGAAYAEAAQRATQKSPNAVIQLFMIWDLAGKRGSHGQDKGYDQAYASVVCWIPKEQCQTDEPAYDAAAIIDGYTINDASLHGDSAVVEVVGSRIAEFDGTEIRQNKSSIRWIVTLRRLDGRWRIVSPESQRIPWVSIEAALQRYARTRSDTVALMQIRPNR